MALGAALAISVGALDLLVGEGLGIFFDLCFVGVCVVLALAVRPQDFFTVGVLPPLLMLGLFVMLSVSDPGALARPEVSSVQAVVSGLSHHSGSLALGYLLCLVVLFVRQHVQRTRVV